MTIKDPGSRDNSLRAVTDHALFQISKFFVNVFYEEILRNCKISWCPVNLFIIGTLVTLSLFPFMCCVMNHSRHRDRRVIVFVSET